MKTRYIHFLIGMGLFLISFLWEVDEINVTAIGIAAWMVYWWITQPIPIYVTALIPLLVSVPAGLMNDLELAQAYGNKMVFLFFGGFVIALGIEKRDLHRQFARLIITSFGNSPPRLLLSFMLATAFLSMWISNTATALMMLPMALSVISSIPRFRLKKKFALALLLGLAYASNIGGTATLIGTPPNVQLAGILEQQFGYEVTFFEWFSIGFPFMLVSLLMTYFVLKLIFLKNIQFEVHHQEVHPLNGNQKRILFVFILVSFLWMMNSLINTYLPFKLNDTMIALFGALLMFTVPAKDENGTLLKWNDVKQLPWGILFLFGGGLALAGILANGRIIEFLVQGFNEINTIPLIFLLGLIFTVTIFATELMSNLALVSLLLPVIGQFVLTIDSSLFHVCAGVALCSSCAFMLPVATPPNAIIYSSQLVSVKAMFKIGLLLNLLTIGLVTGWIYWWVTN